MNLKLGDKGTNVKDLQTKLGLDDNDGIFGNDTKSAVIAWQQNNSLPQTGIVDDKMWSLLFPQQPADESLLTQALKDELGDTVTKQLIEAMQKFPITNKYRIAHLLAQCAHESMNFTHTAENMNYNADALRSIFKVDSVTASRIAHNPQAIANTVYANHYGNGGPETNDGWNFRGKGYLGTTFKANYIALRDHTGIDVVSNPDLVTTDLAMISGAFYFDNHHLWSICDKGISRDIAIKVTTPINAKCLGLEERIKYLNKFYNLLQ